MRWERLFADLEARFEKLADEEAEAESADRERVAGGSITALERLAGALDQPVQARLVGGARVGGLLRSVGPDWLLVTEGSARDCLVPLRSVAVMHGLTATTGQAPSGLELRLDLRYALRALARDRAPVLLALLGWTGDSGSITSAAVASGELTGTIDRVGADFLEIALHAAWEPRRAGAVRSVVLVPLRSILLVRAMPLG
ncbi:MAG TPA: hypothetical protein VIU11_19990 [Nakamurella sp.]